jgi:hypothetical protein
VRTISLLTRVVHVWVRQVDEAEGIFEVGHFFCFVLKVFVGKGL